MTDRLSGSLSENRFHFNQSKFNLFGFWTVDEKVTEIMTVALWNLR